jgi:hypothetical protein
MLQESSTLLAMSGYGKEEMELLMPPHASRALTGMETLKPATLMIFVPGVTCIL